MAAPEQVGTGPDPAPAADAVDRRAADPDGPLVRVDRCGADVTVISMSGEIDLDSVPGVEQAVLAVLQDSAGHRIVVELNGVRLLGACGLALLVAAHEQAARRGGEVALVVDERAPAARTLGHVPDTGVPVFGTMTAALAGGHPAPAPTARRPPTDPAGGIGTTAIDGGEP